MRRSRARVRVFSDDGHCVADARVMRRALEYVRAFDGVVSQHAQDPASPARGAAATRARSPAGSACPAGPPSPRRHHRPRRRCSPSTPAAGCTSPTSPPPARSTIVRWAKARGIDVTAEVTPHHLLLHRRPARAATTRSTRSTRRCGPARTRRRCARRLADGTIDAVATDHAPHARHDKEHAFVDAAFGMLGLETAFAVVHDAAWSPTGRLDWADVAAADVDRPGPIAGLADHGRPGRRRRTRPTSCSSTRAAMVGVDRDASQSLSRNTPWHGQADSAGAVAHHDPARPRHGRAEGAHRMLTQPREPAVLVLEDGRTFTGEAYGAGGDDRRRGGVLHRHDRLPGDAHRPELPPPGRRHDRPARRQHRLERRGRRVGPDLGGRLRRARPGAAPVQLALEPRSLDDELRARASSGISGIDTRALTRHLRERGAMRVGIFSGDDADAARALLARVQRPRRDGRRRPRRRGRHRREPTSCRRWGRSGSPSPRSTSASRP